MHLARLPALTSLRLDVFEAFSDPAAFTLEVHLFKYMRTRFFVYWTIIWRGIVGGTTGFGARAQRHTTQWRSPAAVREVSSPSRWHRKNTV